LKDTPLSKKGDVLGNVTELLKLHNKINYMMKSVSCALYQSQDRQEILRVHLSNTTGNETLIVPSLSECFAGLLA
jgi:hypothetical protein